MLQSIKSKDRFVFIQ